MASKSTQKYFVNIFMVIIIAANVEWFRGSVDGEMYVLLTLVSWCFITLFFGIAYLLFRFGTAITFESLKEGGPDMDSSLKMIKKQATADVPFEANKIHNSIFFLLLMATIILIIPLIRNNNFMGIAFIMSSVVMLHTGIGHAISVYDEAITKIKTGEFK